MNFIRKYINRYKDLSIEQQAVFFIFPLNITANLSIIGYCIAIAKLPMNYSPIQIFWITFISALITISIETLFHLMVTKPLSNSLIFWQSTTMSAKERTDLLDSTGSYPLKKGVELFLLFISTGLFYSLCAYYLLNVDLHVSVFFFHIYISLSYIYILISIYLLERNCSKFAIKIAAEGIEFKDKKFFGLSQRSNFVIYLVLPIIGTSLVTLHSVYFAVHPQTVHSITGDIGARSLSALENLGLFIKTSFTKPETMNFIIKISVANTISTCILVIFYYARILNNTNTMQNSLVMLSNKEINQHSLFDVNIFSEDSYTMFLINRTILLFDSIIRNNTKANSDIDEISRMLSEISIQTKENVIQQSANIEEILATMQSVDNLSKKVETNFDEVITVASKTMESVDTTFVDLNENFEKISEITDTNSITIDNLTKLSEKIYGIREVINSIDKFAEQTKTVAFNAELEANKISINGVDFTNVAEEIRKLSNNTLELTKRIHAQITDIANASEEIIATGNYCLTKTMEGNEVCIQLSKNFDDIKQSAKATSINSSNIKDSLHEQTKAFHQIVETLSQIAKSVRNFGTSSTTIAETIEKLRQSSSRILELNNKYNHSDDIEQKEGDDL
ncbi:methyl-accepting chemotaxis protein [Treponema sp.]|uniref:methyl-accepting chemotaxis protein n=1 Tax=Treponema sp. TaxID=166 RepID=UPI00298E10F6|nr:methyl-accepting chemotaxis protein [Treponema sp.]MCQ2240491.1 methyl-accepting chemotaxis protein [Treponema sp.]